MSAPTNAPAGPAPASVEAPAQLPPLSAWRRLCGLSGAWALLTVGGPGMVTPDGSLLATALGLALWGAVTLRPFAAQPGRGCLARAGERLAEVLPNAVGGGLTMAWVWFVFPASFLYVAFGFGVYWTATAYGVRALARRLPAALAVTLGVCAYEGLRALLPPPFGLGWLQLGHVTHHHLWLSTSARIWGLEGLTLVVAALGGAGAALLLRRGGRPLVPLSVGLLPLGLGIGFSLTAPGLPEVEGPRVLFVQPGFTQERKQHNDPRDNFVAQHELTRAATAALVEAGTPPDLVVWAESMLSVPLVDPGAELVLAQGGNLPPWTAQLTERDLEGLALWESQWVRGEILGEGPGRLPAALPDGTVFLSGAEIVAPFGSGTELSLRRRVAVALYEHPLDGTPGDRREIWKRNLVPGAESMLGLERLPAVRDTIQEIAAYVPDFVAGEDPGVLDWEDRAGGRWRMGTSICFDNSFLGTFTDVFERSRALRDPDLRGVIDFHLVASNEAWYRGSFELDQMLAFSRIAALATERTVARGTNSGVSIVLGPDGTERGRVRDAEGRDRETRGTLALRLPVPAPEARARRTPYVLARPLWQAAGVLGPLLALLAAAWLRPGSRA